MTRARTTLLAVSLLLVLYSPAASAAGIKAGGSCVKRGTAVTQAGKHYSCVRIGKKLVWRLVKPAASSKPKALSQGEFTIVPRSQRVAFPKWSGHDLDGQPWSTDALVGTVAVVNVWASWCGPCREEWPALQSAAGAHPTVRFFGINTVDSLPSARAFIAEHPSSYLQIFDDRGVIKASLTTVPNFVMPISMMLDARGRIAAWVLGATTVGSIDKALAAI